MFDSIDSALPCEFNDRVVKDYATFCVDNLRRLHVNENRHLKTKYTLQGLTVEKLTLVHYGVKDKQLYVSWNFPGLEHWRTDTDPRTEMIFDKIIAHYNLTWQHLKQVDLDFQTCLVAEEELVSVTFYDYKGKSTNRKIKNSHYLD